MKYIFKCSYALSYILLEFSLQFIHLVSCIKPKSKSRSKFNIAHALFTFYLFDTAVKKSTRVDSQHLFIVFD